ncbi:hypothetical protein [Pseudorhodobacter sp. MZDSW-24AT]|uniref:hypothetical protein n=1 Tax=Pseudorhodobacter sp. MZDSW-24AT TaxID=2052957 RepID=UPI000C1E03A1|nr:hypothetical protein [Pseudorhodobacter sp. MZDSW-24AT]PJF10716.1 hypothetical protein CUR21_01775 [Pseudorhodobacter sp. MZDSW-24AT]
MRAIVLQVRGGSLALVIAAFGLWADQIGCARAFVLQARGGSLALVIAAFGLWADRIGWVRASVLQARGGSLALVIAAYGLWADRIGWVRAFVLQVREDSLALVMPSFGCVRTGSAAGAPLPCGRGGQIGACDRRLWALGGLDRLWACLCLAGAGGSLALVIAAFGLWADRIVWMRASVLRARGDGLFCLQRGGLSLCVERRRL